MFWLMYVTVVVLGAMPMAYAGLSVWDQMKTGDLSSVTAKIVGVQLLTNQVRVVYTIQDGKTVIQRTTSLCEDPSGVNMNQATGVDSEERRAVYLKARIDSLLEAKRSGESVQLSLTGGWDDCLQTIGFSQK